MSASESLGATLQLRNQDGAPTLSNAHYAPRAIVSHQESAKRRMKEPRGPRQLKDSKPCNDGAMGLGAGVTISRRDWRSRRDRPNVPPKRSGDTAGVTERTPPRGVRHCWGASAPQSCFFHLHWPAVSEKPYAVCPEVYFVLV